MKLPIKIPEENIKPININGLNGRLIHIKNPNSGKVIIYIHGLHTLAERHYSLCDYLSDFGEVYGPDLPGFGGMDDFYRIGLKPSIDNYADYIFSFIKSLDIPKNKQIVIVGLSFGCQVMIRLLQKHPEIVKMEPIIISFAGIASSKDIKPLRLFRTFVYPLAFICKTKYGSKFIDLLLFNPLILRLILLFMVRLGSKNDDEPDQRKDVYAMEYNLWRRGHTRTHGYTTWMLFHQDLTQHKAHRIPLTIHNAVVSGDQYIDANKNAVTMRKIFEDYIETSVELGSHAPSIVADKHAVERLFPTAINELLEQ